MSDTNFAQLAQQLQAALEAASFENERLEKTIMEAKARAEDAERRAAESEEKFHAAEDLRKPVYQAVISDLFRRPSRNAALLTVVVGVVAIAVGLLSSYVQSQQFKLLLEAKISGIAAASAPAPAPLKRTPIVIDATSNRALGLSLSAGQSADFRIPATAQRRLNVFAQAISGDVQVSSWQDSPAHLLCKGGGPGAAQASCSFTPLHNGDVTVRVTTSKASVIQFWWE